MATAVPIVGADAPPKPRILIVDDSAVARAVLVRAVEQSGRFAVVGVVGTARAALAFLGTTRVDTVLLDIAMPGVDGLTALPDLLAAGCGAKVLIVSSSAADGAAATVQALALGAADTLVKPLAGTSAKFEDALLAKLDGLTERLAAPVRVRPSPAPRSSDAYDIVAIGASTGGIHALGTLLRKVPASFRLPILVTQHLPASFMQYFAAQLAVLAGRPCDVASDRLRIRPGRIVIAPGDAHITVVSLGDGGAAIRLSKAPVPSGCMPSVDPMLATLSQVYGPRMLAVVLSGMGRDGAEGARVARAAGGCVVVQDQASSVVWGMPGAVAAQGDADAMLTPEAIGDLVALRRRP